MKAYAEMSDVNRVQKIENESFDKKKSNSSDGSLSADDIKININTKSNERFSSNSFKDQASAKLASKARVKDAKKSQQCWNTRSYGGILIFWLLLFEVYLGASR